MSWLAGFGPQLLHGLMITVIVSICALIFGLLLAIIFALIQFSQSKIIKTMTVGIITLIRGLPELLVLFAIYFGGSILFSSILHRPAQVSAFLAGVLALGSIFAAYASQTLRGAFLAIPKGQAEAGKALGLSNWIVFKRILFPQAWRHALPGLSNLWLVLLKDSALVSLIGLGDLMNKSQLAASTTHQFFKFYLFAALCFLLLTTVSQWFLKYHESH